MIETLESRQFLSAAPADAAQLSDAAGDSQQPYMEYKLKEVLISGVTVSDSGASVGSDHAWGSHQFVLGGAVR